MGVPYVLEQPVRVVGLALACALATATLATVTFVVSNLVLSVIAVLGPAVPPSAAASDDGAVQGVLLSGSTETTQERCRSLRRPEVRGPDGLLDGCTGRRAPGASARP